MTNITDIQWAYISGLTDGEGCCSIQKMRKALKNGKIYENYALNLRIAMKNKQTIHFLKNTTSKGRIYKDKRGLYIWYLYGEEAAEVIEKIIENSIEKKPQLEKALEFIKLTDKEKKREIYEEMKHLKRV